MRLTSINLWQLLKARIAAFRAVGMSSEQAAWAALAEVEDQRETLWQREQLSAAEWRARDAHYKRQGRQRLADAKATMQALELADQVIGEAYRIEDQKLRRKILEYREKTKIA